jgi:hypothetical protein
MRVKPERDSGFVVYHRHQLVVYHRHQLGQMAHERTLLG